MWVLLVVLGCLCVGFYVESGWVWQFVCVVVIILVSFDPDCFAGRSFASDLFNGFV